MTLTLVREGIIKDTIIGRLYLGSLFLGHTIENEEKAIMCGVYKISYCKSPKFGCKLPLIYNDTDVKPNRGIRIHNGNTYLQSKGCILLGKERDKDTLKKSAEAVETLCRLFDMNPNIDTLEIV